MMASITSISDTGTPMALNLFMNSSDGMHSINRILQVCQGGGLLRSHALCYQALSIWTTHFYPQHLQVN